MSDLLTKEQRDELELKSVRMDGLVHRDVLKLTRHIRAEQAREQRLEDVARKYGLCSKAVKWAFVWMTVHDTSNDTTGIGMSTSTFPTRRSCDDAILQAVAAYENGGGK